MVRMSTPLRVMPILLVALLALPSPASGAAPTTLDLNLVEYEFGLEPSGIILLPGENVTLHIRNVGDVDHNLYVGENGVLAKLDPTIKPGGQANLTFTVPATATGPVIYYCAVSGHRELGMAGNLTLKGQVIAGAGGPASAADQTTAITRLGVSYYAYWVGVISFIVLFAVLAVTFFVLRYGESKHWTDWKDRPARKPAEGEAPPPRPVGTYVAMLIVVVVALVAAVEVLNVVR
ncbi:MAG: hypothetical protein LC624_05800 [Halobacteriales archaeon]|nr:hypothetical protein [Halobacteriales archaeon]